LAEQPDAAGEHSGRDALLAAALSAVDPAGVGSIRARTDFGESCQQWLEVLGGLLPASVSVRRVPAHIDDERLLGGIDLAATLGAGRAVHALGLLA
jgi:magnesium chelatase subunit D